MSRQLQTRPKLVHLTAGFVITALLGMAGCSGAGGPSPSVTVFPSSISFGNVPPGASGTQSVQLTNSGSSTLTISSDSLTGTEFSMSGLTAPLTLGAGQSASFIVDFTPTVAGAQTGDVALASHGHPPTNIPLKGTSHWVTLDWTSSTSTNVVGYYVYRAKQTGGAYSQLNSTPLAATKYRDTNVSPGSTYYYVITAVNADGIQSANSNVASAAVPNP